MSERNIVRINPIPKMPGIKHDEARKLRVAAYARVSTDHEDQQNSFDAQVDYYKKLIAEHLEWEFVRVYADEGISGCRTDGRVNFLQMIEDCDKGLIDLILTKSVSRFARNTVDSISTIRHLKSKGIGVWFEKENILSLDSKGEFVLTLMSSLAQEESRSISENVAWGQRKRFADGKSSLAYSRFLGYDQGPEKYQMVVNEEQARVVRMIFRMFLQGHTPQTISNKLTEAGCLTPAGLETWNQTTVRRMLSNEKYKGDALLQKDFTVDFLRKKVKKNCGELPQYYVEGDHEAIIAPWLFDYVQEIAAARMDADDAKRRGRYSGVYQYSSKIICAKCGRQFGIKPFHSTTYNNLVWQCRNRYNKKVNCKTINIYDAYLHVITHTAAMERIRRQPKVVRDLMDCVQMVVGDERSEEIHTAIKSMQRETVWKLWSDEDDLSLIIGHLGVHADGRVVVYWLDGKETEYQTETFRPTQYFSEKEERPPAAKKPVKK